MTFSAIKTYSLFILALSMAQLTLQKDFPPESRNCNTAPANPLGDHYIIEYGSLMNSASKDRTDNTTGPNIPVEVRGFSRSWNCRGQSIGLRPTYLGINTNTSGALNAAAFKLSSYESLDAFDRREDFYCREEVRTEDITLLGSPEGKSQLPPGQYWIYVTKTENTGFPTISNPIIQSYVDTFLSGCLELEELYKLENFALQCVQTTETASWYHPYVNDRIFPRRPFLHQPKANQIDALLFQVVPDAFKSITIE